MLAQADERTVRSDEGFKVSIADPKTVIYEQDGRSVRFTISVQCCGDIEFVLHTHPPAEHWHINRDDDPVDARIPLSREEYENIVIRTKKALEYLQLLFAID